MQSIENSQIRVLNNETRVLGYKADGVDLLCGKIEGHMLMSRYQIESFIDQGKFGRIYNITDLTKNRPQKPLVVKLLDYSKDNMQEVKIMSRIWKSTKTSKAAARWFGKVPKVCKFGYILHVEDKQFVSQVKWENVQKGIFKSYIIMPRMHMNLQTFFDKRKEFSDKSIYSLGIQLLNIFEQIHEAGFVYNDLKLDNLMIDD